MTQNENIHTKDDRVFDEFSPKKIILIVQRSGNYLLSKWKTIIGISLLFGITGSIFNSCKKPTYTAEITFALDEGAAQSTANNYSQLKEQLGMETMLDAGGVFSSMTNIVELMQSRLLVEKTLKRSVKIDDHSVVFADFFLDSLRYRNKWMKASPYKSTDFLSTKIDEKEKLFQNDILRNIYETLLAKNLKTNKKGNGTSIISVTCVSENELFSKYFLEALIDEVTRYYIDTKTQRAKTNVAFLQHRTDSIKSAFVGALYGRATVVDADINLIRQITSVTPDRQQTDIQILKSTYVDLVSSLEIAKTTLMRETPLIQYIDLPVLPLKKDVPSGFRSFLLFAVIGIFVVSFFLLFIKMIRHIAGNEPDVNQNIYIEQEA